MDEEVEIQTEAVTWGVMGSHKEGNPSMNLSLLITEIPQGRLNNASFPISTKMTTT